MTAEEREAMTDELEPTFTPAPGEAPPSEADTYDVEEGDEPAPDEDPESDDGDVGV